MEGAATPQAPLSDARKRQIVVGVLTAMFLAALDQTIVAPAMTTIGQSLGHAQYLPWVISAYLITGTAVTPLYGKLADIHGRRPILVLAVSIFLVGSVICALAPSLGALVAGRAIQGLGGGGLIALAQTVLGDLVPPKQRAKFAAQISAVWAAASLAGPIVGGVFAQHLHWSLVFWINLPLGFIAFAMMNGPLKDLPFTARPHRLDIPGAILVVAGTSAAMLALSLGRMTGEWGSAEVLGLAGAAVFATLGFVWRVRSFVEPLIPISVLKDRVVLFGTSAVALGMAGFVGLTTIVPAYFETQDGVSPDIAAMGLIAMGAGAVIGAAITGRKMPKMRRYRMPALIGHMLSVAALGALAASVSSGSFLLSEVLLFLYGLGLGPIFPIATVSVQNAVAQHDLGAATGLLAFLRSMGAAFGVAILGAIVLGAGGGEGAPRAVMAIDPSSFRWAFLAAMLSTAAALACLWAMPERPLRDTMEPAGPPAE
ncbi:MFS transporter [Methylopila sp. M107]|uniref:MFS transporter n=1 Tax=Methylopila sp. M107 TaxID=1101190 RepID=UPI000376E4C0|nr:MFS transporter [Methylopila sp. M107]